MFVVEKEGGGVFVASGGLGGRGWIEFLEVVDVLVVCWAVVELVVVGKEDSDLATFLCVWSALVPCCSRLVSKLGGAISC